MAFSAAALARIVVVTVASQPFEPAFEPALCAPAFRCLRQSLLVQLADLAKGRRWASEEVALQQVAAHVRKGFGFDRGFNTFGYQHNG